MVAKVRVIILPVSGGMKVQDIENTADGYHQLIGNWIEVFTLPEVLRERRLVGVCDEEGWLEHRPRIPNIYSSLLSQSIAGHIIITKDDGYGDFISVSDDDINLVQKYFGPFRIK